MMKLYHAFINSSLDISPLGLEVVDEQCSVPFAPRGAKVIARLTKNPEVCFCLVDSMGTTVFAVDPDAADGDCIHPVAENLLQFIGMLISCPDAALLAGIHRWSKLYFDNLATGLRPGGKTASVLRAFQNTYHPPVIQDPWSATAELEAQFPIGKASAPWHVGFGKDFGEDCGKQTPGKVIPLNRSFNEKGVHWQIPVVYACPEGVVVDAVLQIPPEQILSYQKRWANRSQDVLSIPDQLSRGLEDPLLPYSEGLILVNEKPVRPSQTFTRCWDPLLENSPECLKVLKHFGLNRNNGYLLYRFCFPRKGKQPPIRTLQLCLNPIPTMVPGDRFTAAAGKKVAFTHPATGTKHILTVISQTQEALNPNFLTNHPCCYNRLVYTLEPAIGGDGFRVVDQDPGDPWENVSEDPLETVGNTGKAPGRVAISSLRHTPTDRTTWRMLLRCKPRPDVRIKLLP